MEIKKIHDIEIFINEKKADIYSTSKLNLRFNNMFADPSKIQTISTEYSFSFTLPITRINNDIFDHANIPSKRNKFNKRYKTHVNVDGILIFDGELILTSISEEGYKCNLYINKLNTVDKIFGDSVLSDIMGWNIPYDQQVTINETNQKEDLKYPNDDCFFPLVSYGMFQKERTTNNVYTPKHTIDDTNFIYNENFYPSINLLKTVEKCFEHKGYKVEGDIFDDEVMKRIYMSTSIGKEQDPTYNYGKPEMGQFEMSFTYTNRKREVLSANQTRTYFAASVEKDLEQKLFPVGASRDGVQYYNWEKVNIYDIFSASSKLLENKTFVKPNNIIWRNNRIVAPCDGWYKIDLTLNYSLDDTTEYKFPRYYYQRPDRVATVERVEIPVTQAWTFKDFSTEFQLVKNSEDGTEIQLIEPYAVDKATVFDYRNYSLYPHEKPSVYTNSTEDNPYPYGYSQEKGDIIGYDPRCNKNFVMGCCHGGAYGYNAVIKNGKSWDSACSDVNKSMYPSAAYYGIKVTYNQSTNEWIPEPERTSGDKEYGKGIMKGGYKIGGFYEKNGEVHLSAIVQLKKNDYLQLKMITRQWLNKEIVDKEESDSTSGRRNINSNDARINVTKGKISFECFSPIEIQGDPTYIYNFNNPTIFPTDLDLSNFLSNDEKMSDFINNFIKEFNLSYSQNGNVITINKQKIDNTSKNAIDLTDRISENEIVMDYIDFPSQMSVQYTINDEERGFYLSAEKNATDEQIQSNSWKDYADRGYDIISITDDEYANESKATTKTSFNWYDRFKVTQDGQNTEIDIPVIAKDEWLIEGLKPDEFMKEDGLSFKRRYWFPSTLTDTYLLLNKEPDRKAYIRLCSNTYKNNELSYKNKHDGNETLLTNYFNVLFDSDTNYITFDAYLTTDEYVQLKNGSDVIVDDDVYIVVEIQGYDCSGNNKTTIKALKK